MEKSTILAALTLFTLLSGMAIGAHQLWSAEKAKRDDNPSKPDVLKKS